MEWKNVKNTKPEKPGFYLVYRGASKSKLNVKWCVTWFEVAPERWGETCVTHWGHLSKPTN